MENDIRLPEWERADIEKNLASEPVQVLYLYTPMCGTCQLAEKMLSVTLHALPHINAGKANVNFIPRLAEEWRVESVPCLLLIRDGEVQQKIYAFHSVDYLYQLLKDFSSSNQ